MSNMLNRRVKTEVVRWPIQPIPSLSVYFYLCSHSVWL